MWFFIFLTFISDVSSNPDCLYIQKISGGKKTSLDHYPFMVSIKNVEQPKEEHWCSGTIINRLWVMTAAHCICPVDDCLDPEDLLVFAGVEDLLKGGNVKGHRVGQIKFGYNNSFTKNKEQHKNDLALLKLEEGLNYTSFIQPIKLPLNNFVLNASRCTTVGWGKGYTKMEAVELEVIPNRDCEESGIIPFHIPESQYCTVKENKSVDSGAPLLCNGVQVGIAARGVVCVKPNSALIWTKVVQYLAWIEDTSKGDIVVGNWVTFWVLIGFLYIETEIKII